MKENREWRRPHNEEFHSLDCSSNIFKVIKSRLRWAGHKVKRQECFQNFNS